MQRILNPNSLNNVEDVRQSYSSRVHTHNQLVTEGGPIQQYTDRFNYNKDDQGEIQYSQGINRKNRLPDNSNGPTFPEHTGHEIMSQNLPAF